MSCQILPIVTKAARRDNWGMRAILLASVLVLSGCSILTIQNDRRREATRARNKAAIEKYTAACESWIGQSARDLVDKWGAPSSVTPRPGGGQIYVFEAIGKPVLRTVSWDNGSNTVVDQRVCKRTFMTTKKEIVESARWSGDCVLLEEEF